MEILVNLDVMMAKRKISSGELAERIGITPANLSILKNNKAKAIRFSTLVALCHELQSLDHFKIQGIDVPIEVAARFYQVVVKTGQFFQFNTVIGQCADDGASACGAQVNGKKMLLVFHCFDLLAVLLRMSLGTFGSVIIYMYMQR